MRMKNREEVEVIFSQEELREALLDYLRQELDGCIPEGKPSLLPGNTGLRILREEG